MCVRAVTAGKGAPDRVTPRSGGGVHATIGEGDNVISRSRARLLAAPAVAGALGLGVLAGCSQAPQPPQGVPTAVPSGVPTQVPPGLLPGQGGQPSAAAGQAQPGAEGQPGAQGQPGAGGQAGTEGQGGAGTQPGAAGGASNGSGSGSGSASGGGASQTPSGGVATGGGSTSGVEHAGLIGGGVLALVGAGALGAAARRRRQEG